MLNETPPARGFWLMVLVMSCTVALGAMLGALFISNIIYERNTAVEVARRAASNLAESLARHAADAFSATDCALFGLAERVENERPNQAGRERLRMWMAMQVMMVPRMHELRVVDEHGRLQAGSSSTVAASVLDFREMSYYRDHPDARGRIHAANGHDGWQILVSRRARHGDGSFAGAVIAVIEPAYFEKIYETVDVGRLGMIALLDADGTVMVRKPAMLLGRSRLHPELFSSSARLRNSGTYVGFGLGNARSLFAFRRLEQFPFTVLVGVSESEYLAGWRAAAVLNTIVLGLVFVTTGALAIILRFQMRRRKRAEDILAQMALSDGLTGLANRRQLNTVLEREWKRAQRDDSALGLLMIDVDNFKAYNDRYGHLEGDNVLVAIAGAIARCLVRGGDLAARYGGEEFAVILPATDTTGAYVIGERIREAVVTLGLFHADAADAIATVSVGVAAIVPSVSIASSVLVKAADNALYDAKRFGRNRTVVMPSAEQEREISLSVPRPA